MVALLALAGCGAVNSPGADKKPVESDDKSPLAEYMGEGFSNGGGMMRITRAVGGGGSDEEQLAKQRKLEDSVAACMKAAGFEYVAVPPESNPKSKFDEAFNLPPDKFAEQYGYGISTIDWGKPAGEDESDPNAKIRKALSPNAQKAYDKALNGELAGKGGVVQAVPADGKRPALKDMGCRGKAGEEVFGKGDDKMDDFSKFESLFKDLEALRKRVDSDQRVVDATSAWSDCMADAGHSGLKKIDDPRNQISAELDELTGTKKPQKGGPSVVIGAPSLDKVDAAKLADLRKKEIELAKTDQGCKAKTYDAPYKQASTEHEKEFVTQHKAELEQYRDTMAER
ncbi:hypothetical protein GCM10009741_48750 [Kribbella lupini]|uniref:Uncharacterized protein n=1 Tax=Kribbella lupini TaxID=291602 RepID=A0ABN2BJH8_9ACTN